MRWSWKLGRFAEIDTYVHASFLLLVGWAAWAAWSGAGTLLSVALGVGFLLGHGAEWIFTIVAIVFATSALLLGWSRHRSRGVASS